MAAWTETLASISTLLLVLVSYPIECMKALDGSSKISAGFASATSASFGLWGAHSLVIGSWGMALSNFFGFVAAGMLCICLFRRRNKCVLASRATSSATEQEQTPRT